MRKFLLSLFLILSLFFSFGNLLVNAGGFSASNYGINITLKKKIDNILNNISVKIIKKGGKEGELYNNIIKKINKLIEEKTKEGNIKLVNILKYMKDYLNLSLDIYPIVENDPEYDKIFKEFISNKMNYQSGLSYYEGYYKKRENLDKKTIEKNKKLFLELFKENKLPILKKIKVAENEIFITSAYSNFFQNLDNLPKSCGYYFSPGGFANYNICVEIIKKGEKYELKYGDLVFDDWNKNNLKIKDNKYIINSFSDGDGGGMWGYKKLLDKNLNLIQKINIGECGCNGINKKIYTKNGLSFSFSSGKKGILLEIYKKSKYDKEEYKNIKVSRMFFDGKINIDIEKNLFNGNNFEFSIGGKKYIYNIDKLLKINDLYVISNDDYDLIFSLYKTNSLIDGKNVIVLEGKFDFSRIKSVKILSCDKNGDNYDSSYYKLKKVVPGTDKFQYKIHKDYGNLCTKLPYIIDIETTNGGKIVKVLNIDFLSGDYYKNYSNGFIEKQKRYFSSGELKAIINSGNYKCKDTKYVSYLGNKFWREWDLLDELLKNNKFTKKEILGKIGCTK